MTNTTEIISKKQQKKENNNKKIGTIETAKGIAAFTAIVATLPIMGVAGLGLIGQINMAKNLVSQPTYVAVVAGICISSVAAIQVLQKFGDNIVKSNCAIDKEIIEINKQSVDQQIEQFEIQEGKVKNIFNYMDSERGKSRVLHYKENKIISFAGDKNKEIAESVDLLQGWENEQGMQQL